MRSIIDVDLDVSYGSSEQRDRPERRGRPVVAGDLHAWGVVATASFEVFPLASSRPRLAAPHVVSARVKIGFKVDTAGGKAEIKVIQPRLP